MNKAEQFMAGLIVIFILPVAIFELQVVWIQVVLSILYIIIIKFTAIQTWKKHKQH